MTWSEHLRCFHREVDHLQWNFTWTESSPAIILGDRKLETLGYQSVKRHWSRTSSLKLDPYCQRQNVAQTIWYLTMCCLWGDDARYLCCGWVNLLTQEVHVLQRTCHASVWFSLTKTKTKKMMKTKTKLKRENRKRLKIKMPKQQSLSLNESVSIQYGAYRCYGHTTLNPWLTVDVI